MDKYLNGKERPRELAVKGESIICLGNGAVCSSQAPDQGNGGTASWRADLLQITLCKCSQNHRKILRMIPKTKPEFEISISSNAFRDCRSFLLWGFYTVLFPKGTNLSAVTS